MQDHGDEAVNPFARIIEEWIDAHAVKKNEEVTEEDGQWMPHEQVIEPLGLGGFQKIRRRHDRKGTDVRAAQLGIVVVMMVVGTAPDAARAEREDAEYLHDDFRQTGGGQDGVMLLIVVDDKKTEDEEAGQDAAGEFAREVKIPESAGDGGGEQQRGGEQIKPASHSGIHSEGFGCQNKGFPGSQVTINSRCLAHPGC